MPSESGGGTLAVKRCRLPAARGILYIWTLRQLRPHAFVEEGPTCLGLRFSGPTQRGREGWSRAINIHPVAAAPLRTASGNDSGRACCQNSIWLSSPQAVASQSSRLDLDFQAYSTIVSKQKFSKPLIRQRDSFPVPPPPVLQCVGPVSLGVRRPPPAQQRGGGAGVPGGAHAVPVPQRGRVAHPAADGGGAGQG